MELQLSHTFTISTLGTQVYEDVISQRILCFENFTGDMVITGIINNNLLDNDLIGRIFIYLPLKQDYSERIFIETRLIYGGKYGALVPFPSHKVTNGKRLIISIVLKQYVTPVTLNFYSVVYPEILTTSINAPNILVDGQTIGDIQTIGISNPEYSITGGNLDLDLDTVLPYEIDVDGNVIVLDSDDVLTGVNTIGVKVTDTDNPEISIESDIDITR
jgi:hypothetical protein